MKVSDTGLQCWVHRADGVREPISRQLFSELKQKQKLIIMPANSTNELVHLWQGLYGGLAHLYTPARKERIRPWLPYALDNGRFAEAVKGLPFDEAGFLAHLERYAFLAQRPQWIAVPDVPFFGEETLRLWDSWEPRLRQYGIPLALVVQNGMAVDQVVGRLQPNDLIFVGGDTEWKWATVGQWAKAWPRVHVGRVNSSQRLKELLSLRVESCDGSGWFRGKAPQVVGLGRFLAEQAGADPSFAEVCARATRFHSDHGHQTVINFEGAA